MKQTLETFAHNPATQTSDIQKYSGMYLQCYMLYMQHVFVIANVIIVMTQSGQEAMQDTEATRRRFIGHIPHLPSTRPASMAVEWKPDDGRKKRGRPKKTFSEKSIFNGETQCSSRDRKN